MKKEKIELNFNQVKKLEWSNELFEDLDETIELLEKQKPYFRFFKNGEAEIVYAPKDFQSIGYQGVEGEEWESFLEELKNLGVI